MIKRFEQMDFNEDWVEELGEEHEKNKHKDLFIESLQTLFFSWGGDTPPEVYWGGNALLDWYEKQFNIKLNIRFDEENQNFEEVVQKILEL